MFTVSAGAKALIVTPSLVKVKGRFKQIPLGNIVYQIIANGVYKDIYST